MLALAKNENEFFVIKKKVSQSSVVEHIKQVIEDGF